MSFFHRAPMALVALALVSPCAADDAHRDVKRSFPARPGLVLDVTNLAGEVSVEGVAGGAVEVSATVHAEGDRAEKLADSLQVTFEEKGDRLRVLARYPTDEHRSFRYPGRRHREENSFDWFGINRSTFEYEGRRVSVATGRHGGGAALWADFRLRVPAGVAVQVRNHVGFIEAKDVAAALTLDTSSGDVRSSGGSGAVHVDTGSGDVGVYDRGDGRLRLETGSGDVAVRGAKGDVEVSTGSGDVRLERVEAASVRVNTGSGDVTLADVSGSLSLNTGSGEIRGSRLARAERVRAGTGSGGVELDGDLTGMRAMNLSTSSGDVRVRMARAFPMRVTATTGSGEIDVDAPGLRTLRRKEHEVIAEVQGSGGADVRVDTSSGNVQIEAR